MLKNEWFTLKDISEMTGYSYDTIKTRIIPELMLTSVNFMLANSKLGGYHNTQKFYNIKVVEAVKEYQQSAHNNTKNVNVQNETANTDNQTWYDIHALAQLSGYTEDNCNKILREINENTDLFSLNRKYEMRGSRHNVKTAIYNIKVLEAIKAYQLKSHGNTKNADIQNETTMQIMQNAKQVWYSVEDLADLSGFDVKTLTKGDSPLTKLNIDFKVESRKGGYHNTRVFYSDKVLKSLKEYQITHSMSNAIKNKETVIQGNISFIEQETVLNTINNLLDNPELLAILVAKSSEKCQALGIENKQLKDVIKEQTPKVEYYDNYLNSENLEEIGQFGKRIKIGAINIFKYMVRDNFIYSKYVDGVKFYEPYAQYEKYFESRPSMFDRNGTRVSRDKLMLNKTGVVYFSKVYGKKENSDQLALIGE